MSIGGFQDPRGALSGLLEMRVDVLDAHLHVLVYFAGPRRPELASLAAQHDGALGDGQLCMADDATL